MNRLCVRAINWDKAEPQKGESAQFCTVSLSIFSRKSWGSTVIWFHLSKKEKKAHWHYFALMICFVFSLLRVSLWVVAVVILWCGNPTYTGYSFHTHFCILKYLGKILCNITFQGDGWFIRGWKGTQCSWRTVVYGGNNHFTPFYSDK